MEAPLSLCAKAEQHAELRFLWAEVIPEAEIQRRLSAQYGTRALPQQLIVYEWVTKLKTVAQVSLPVHIHDSKTLNESMPRLCIPEGWLSMKWHIVCASVMDFLMNSSNSDWFLEDCARWFPKQLTERHRCYCFTVRQGLLNSYLKGEAFSRRTVSVTKMWVHHYGPESKRPNME
jgi:hypothetical protein